MSTLSVVVVCVAVAGFLGLAVWGIAFLSRDP